MAYGNDRIITRPDSNWHGVTDAVIRGDGVRLVLAPQTTPAVEKLLPGVDGAELQAFAPRFEDGFVAMLGERRQKKTIGLRLQ